MTESIEEEYDVHDIPGCDGRALYTSEEVESEPETDAEMFRVVGVVHYTEKPKQKNTYFVPSDNLKDFLMGYDEVGEEFIDIRPVSREQISAEIHD